ncbi:transglutaminase domain-containing protein [Tessaracoccus sp.]
MGRMINAVVLAMGAVVPVAWLAPRPVKTGGAQAPDELVWALRDQGLQGSDLVDEAMHRVAAEYTHESLWHMWESPETSLARGRGWSHQYNTVLLEVLRALGFDAHLVHAARVRGFRHPWWYAGHAWVEVTIDGRQFDACASRTDNRVGDLGFTPVTAELPYRTVTRLGVALALTPFVTMGVWRAWMTGRPVSRWIYRER